MKSRMNRWAMLPLLALIAVAPAACGKKGPPQLPPGQTDQYPEDYPKSTDPQQGIFN